MENLHPDLIVRLPLVFHDIFALALVCKRFYQILIPDEVTLFIEELGTNRRYSLYLGTPGKYKPRIVLDRIHEIFVNRETFALHPFNCYVEKIPSRLLLPYLLAERPIWHWAFCVQDKPLPPDCLIVWTNPQCHALVVSKGCISPNSSLVSIRPAISIRRMMVNNSTHPPITSTVVKDVTPMMVLDRLLHSLFRFALKKQAKRTSLVFDPQGELLHLLWPEEKVCVNLLTGERTKYTDASLEAQEGHRYLALRSSVVKMWSKQWLIDEPKKVSKYLKAKRAFASHLLAHYGRVVYRCLTKK